MGRRNEILKSLEFFVLSYHIKDNLNVLYIVFMQYNFFFKLAILIVAALFHYNIFWYLIIIQFYIQIVTFFPEHLSTF